MVKDGMTVSKVAARRKAAVSARKAHTHAPIADASTKPRVTGAGGTAVLNRSRALLRSVDMACQVLPSGNRPPLNVWGSIAHAANRKRPMAERSDAPPK